MLYDVLMYISRRKLDIKYIKKKCVINNDTIIVPIYKIDWISWYQERYIFPENHWWIKSKTQYWSRWIYFLNWWDKDKDILLVEWEIDFLSILPYSTNYNVMWLKWVNNLSTAIKEIEKLKKVYDVYILVDNDIAADTAIQKIPYTELHLYDVRQALCWCKDVNEAICKWMLNMEFVPKRIVKEKPKPKPIRQFDRTDGYNTIEKINEIPADEILETLFPQYEVQKDWSIKENWKHTNWYKFWKQQNMIVDFSWKWRPQGTTWSVAKAKFKDKHLTFLYFNNRL